MCNTYIHIHIGQLRSTKDLVSFCFKKSACSFLAHGMKHASIKCYVDLRK